MPLVYLLEKYKEIYLSIIWELKQMTDVDLCVAR